MQGILIFYAYSPDMLPSPLYNDRTLLFHRALKFTRQMTFCHTHRTSDLQLAIHYIVEQLCHGSARPEVRGTAEPHGGAYPP